MKDLLPPILSGLPALVAILALGMDWFGWRPYVPPELRRVEITGASAVERDGINEAGGEVAVVFVEIETVGYDADAIAVETVWFDARSLKRALSPPQSHGTLETNTRTDRVVGWLDVEYPFDGPPDSSGCWFIRVLLSVEAEDKDTDETTPAPIHPPYLLAYADTQPFDQDVGPGEPCAENPSDATPEP